MIVPALVALIAENYRGAQQAQAIGSLGSARAILAVNAFFMGGALGTAVGWNLGFLVVLALAIAVFVLSFWLRSDRGNKQITIDTVRAVLVVVGLPMGRAFFVWTRARVAAGREPLVGLSVLGKGKECVAVYAMFIVVAHEAVRNFTVPLSIHIVQGRSPMDTAIAMMPFNLTVFFTAMLVVRFYERFTPRAIGMFGFVMCTAGLVWLAFVVTNSWETFSTILGLFIFGVGQGSLVTLVFNVLVTAAPKEKAGDVGSICGATQNLASAVGTAVAGALLVTVLAAGVGRALLGHPDILQELANQLDMENVTFVSNEALRETLEATDADPTVVEAAIAVNEQVRLDALKRGLLPYAGFSLLALLPAARLPNYRPHEIPDPSPVQGAK